jgi:hypothetical protein
MSGHFCTACGHPLDSEVHFCTSCGHPVDPAAPAPEVGSAAPPPPPAVPAPPAAPPPLGVPAPPVVPPPVGLAPGPGVGPDPERGRRIVAWVGGAVVALLALVTVVVAVASLGGGGDDDELVATATSAAPASSTTASTAPTTAPVPATTAPATTAPATSAPLTGDRGDEAIDAVEARFCPPEPGMEDWTTYITELSAQEIDFELYRVEVRIELDSGGWTAAFDVDFATELGPEIRPLDDESAALLC